MTGTYHGLYPSREEVFDALCSPSATPCPGGQPAGYPALTPAVASGGDRSILHWVAFEDDCLAVGTETEAALYAVETGERFAVYINRDPDPEGLVRDARDRRSTRSERTE